ncbi:hypothetical protein Pmani_016336 [Petrolisthes manimaculis]|uniref:C-type lectin domain-containing protein n=1 Tax=Petrolisthes manimaculis TaxID=1843537 RepID=A0AAE1U6H2_9EUCA|nr:hypothetical protein Pmani_016336 [Petrolisthes manimaculis]
MNGKVGTLFLVLFSCQSGWSLMVARCPSGWDSRGGSDQCYWVHDYGHDRTFDDARAHCQARGGDLAYIDTAGLRDYLGQLVASSDLVGEYGHFWVGAQNIEGSWKWTETGEPLDNIILPWDGTGSGDCAALTVDSELIKQDCDQKLHFICHRNITIPPPCDYDAGWEQQHEMCYKRSDSSDSWNNGLVACDIVGGLLASIHSETENQLAHDFAFSAHDDLWIGLTEETHAGEYKWVDGTNLTFTKWQEGQPDFSQGGYGAALVVRDDEEGMWMTQIVTQDYHFLCKKPQESCLPGWEVFEDSCYYFNTETTDALVWDDAKQTCQDVGASLVIIDNDREDTFFRNHIPETDSLWIGLYSVPEEDKFVWVDGSDMNLTHISDEDQNIAFNSDDRKCVFFQMLGETPSWVPTDCVSTFHYACEVPAGQPITLIPPTNERYCPEGWKQEGDHCYLFMSDEKTWTSARKYCNNHQAYLTSVVTWAEQDFIRINQLAGGWIGFNDRVSDNEWVWSDGSTVTITNWNSGEPSGGDENCAEMKDTGLWNDVPCDSALPFTCKRKASDTPIGVIPTTTPPDSSVCGHGWTENTQTGECYRLVLEELSFADARSECHAYYYDEESETRPDLVSIYSSQEQNFVFNLLSSEHLSQSVIWMGMENDYDGNRWTDDTPSAYFNWNDGEPNGYYYEECIEMYTSTGKWNDGTCDLRHAFICEKKGRNYVGPQLPPPPEVDCPAGWTYFNEHCYYFSSDSANWDTAELNCKSNLGSALASITSQDENEFIRGKLVDSWNNAWLGLHDDNNGDNWHWIDGSPYIYNYWGDGEPNNSQGGEHCGEMIVTEYLFDGDWNDQICSMELPYICKISIGTCPQTWVYNDGKCYYASDFGATWQEGEDKCKLVNTDAELVSIHSDEENAFFTNLLTQSSSSTWIGLNYNSTTSTWIWSDGLEKTYSNWNTNEPNNIDTEMCAEIIDYPGANENGKWNNLPCTETRSFGCEYFPTHVTGCEDGWTAFEDYCYLYSNADYNENTFTYTDAKTECQAMGAKLASIHTEEENDFVFSMLDEWSYTSTWIGMSDDGHSGSLAWTDDTSITFTKFDYIEFYSFSTYPTCAGYSGYDYSVALWALFDCNTMNFYVCKKAKEAIPINPSNTGCYEDDLPYKGSCYSYNAMSATWSKAQDDCSSKHSGSHLVVLNDKYETGYVSAMLSEVGGHTWIGMSGTIGEDNSVTFTWVNGDPVEFTNWNEYEPIPEHGTCVAASGETYNLGFWSVWTCDVSLPYICEYNREDYTTPEPITTKPPESYCLSGWEHKGTRCYKVMKQLLTWGAAEQFCDSFGGHLVSIASANEETIIRGLTGMDDLGGFNRLWVGLKEGSTSGYEWTDGTANAYLNWDAGEPESHGGVESCISADRSSLKLSNAYCDAHLPFVCEGGEGTLVTTVAPPTTPSVTPKCSDDTTWFLYNDYCYKFISESEELIQSWWDSRRMCKEIGGELASIHTTEENYWMESMIYEMTDSSLWIGGQANIDSGYQWSDESVFDFDNWADGEPSNMQDQEACISIYTHDVGGWNDLNCGDTKGRICKRPHGSTHPPLVTNPPPSGHCPSGWIHTGTKCILVQTTKMSFHDARQYCKQLGSGVDLISIHSDKDEAYLMSVLSLVKQHMWLGLMFVDGFHWVDQTSVTYTNWATGEPNGGSGGEECVEVYYDTGKWNDISCDDTYGFICMMVQDPSLDNHIPLTRCPAPYEDYVIYDGACYKSVSTAMTWQDAESACVEDGAHLASILSVGETSFTWVAVLENSFTDSWIGLNSIKDHQLFKWSDGWPVVYSNWGKDQPTVNVTDANCVSLSGEDGMWYNMKCDDIRPFICKYSNETAVTADPPVTGYCPDTRWLDLGGSYCYLISDHTASWAIGNQECTQEKADMVSIHSEEELHLIMKAITNIIHPVWIGLLQTKDNGYEWSDGTGLDFINWDTDEPNSEDEECVEQLADSGYWNDAVCNNKRTYICKINKIGYIEPTNYPPPDNTTPGDGNHGNNGLTAGAISGIVIAVLVVVAGVGFVGFSYIQKQPKKQNQSDHQSFDNIGYNTQVAPNQTILQL